MRNISEIYNSLAQEKATLQDLNDYIVSTTDPATPIDNADQLLGDLKSKSKVAVWRTWLMLMAIATWMVEVMFDSHKTEISEILEAKSPHTLRWYSEQSKLFQYGYALEWIGSQYVYDPVVPEARIVSYAAASEEDSKVVLKVAKLSAGSLSPLSVAEKAAFTEFWNSWRDAGVKMEVVSLAADTLKIDVTIVRDRLVLDGDNNLLRDSSTNPITDAITEFCESLEFDGVLKLSSLVDAIQAAEGVVDVKLNSAYHKPSGESSYEVIDLSVIPKSGYFTLSMIDSSFEYIDNINVGVVTL